MFKDFFLDDRMRLKRMGRKGATVLVSLVLHLTAIMAVIVVPLVRAESELPVLQVADVTIGAVPPAPGVPKGKPGGKSKMAGLTKKPLKSDEQNTKDLRFIPPIKDITTLPEPIFEPLPEGDDGDDGPGVDGGVKDGQDIIKILSLSPDDMERGEVIRTIVSKPRLVHKVMPEYPEAARLAHIQDVVVVEAVTDIYGRVREVRLVRGHPLLNDAAINAVRQWLYEPYLINGIPKAVIFTVTVTFALEVK